MALQQESSQPEVPPPDSSAGLTPTRSDRECAIRSGKPLWMTVTAASLVSFFSLGFMGALGIFQLYYDLHLSLEDVKSAISWVLTTQLFLVCNSTIAWTCSMSFFVLSVSTKYYQIFFSQAVLFGVGLSLAGPLKQAIIFELFQTSALTAWIPYAAINIGDMTWPLIITALVERLGFAWAMRTIGITSLMLTVSSGYLVVHHLQSNKQGSESNVTSKPLSTLRHSALAVFITGNVVTMSGLFIPFYYLPLYAISSGSSEFGSVATITALNLGMAVGMVVSWILSSWLGEFNTLALSAFLSALIIDLMFLQLETPQVMGLSFLFGYCAGRVLILQGKCVGLLVNGWESPLAAYALLCMFSSLTVLTRNPIAGALIEAQHGSFQGLIIFASLTINLGAVVTFISRMIFCPKLLSIV